MSCVTRVWKARVVLRELEGTAKMEPRKPSETWTRYVQEAAARLPPGALDQRFFDAADTIEPKGIRTQRYLSDAMVERMIDFDRECAPRGQAPPAACPA